MILSQGKPIYLHIGAIQAQKTNKEFDRLGRKAKKKKGEKRTINIQKLLHKTFVNTLNQNRIMSKIF